MSQRIRFQWTDDDLCLRRVFSEVLGDRIAQTVPPSKSQVSGHCGCEQCKWTLTLYVTGSE